MALQKRKAQIRTQTRHIFRYPASVPSLLHTTGNPKFPHPIFSPQASKGSNRAFKDRLTNSAAGGTFGVIGI